MKHTTLRKYSFNKNQNAFALPTVLIASTVMLAVLTVTFSSVQSGIIVALDSTHYSRYAKSAAQSGIVMAKACLKANNYVSSWSTNPLKPNTDCSGTIQGGLPAYIHNDATESVRSSFTVAPPTTLANGVQKLTVTATTERTRGSGAVFRTYTESTYAVISAQSSFTSIAFGYQGAGAFFGVIDAQGKVTAVGYNGNGQLGNGTTTNTLTPSPFQLPGTLIASQLYTNFLSMGNNLFAITSDGQLYGSGMNSSGQLGNGAMTAAQSTPVKFQLPAGVLAKYVSQGMAFAYVVGSDNNIYAAGSCLYGALGYSYTISGCSDQSTYKRVALPAVNVSDLNTLPVATSDWVQSTNIATDRSNAYVRMQGGRVYGWGANDRGQLGNGTNNDSSTPLQVTTLGDSGQPKATQVAFDGESFWVLDSNGDVWSAGYNIYGELGAASPVASATGKCIDNPGNATANGTIVRIWDCNNTTAQMIEWAQDGSLIFRPNSSTALCLDNTGSSSANGNPTQIWVCNGGSAQKWSITDEGKIMNPATGKCLDNPGNTANSGTALQLYDCNAPVASGIWSLNNLLTPGKVVLPSGHGKVARMTTDLGSIMYLMTDGTVWGYGMNTAGQLGNGVLSKLNPKVQQYILPVGRTATNFYTTKTGAFSDLYYANTYVVLDDGSVYGSGANTFGQLGTGTTSTTPIATPVKMTLPVGIKAQSVQTGLGTAIILTDQGRIYTVGNNSNGQLGDGTTINSSTPQARQYVNNRPMVLY